jgi:Domain of unknown function (DUF4157)
MEHDTKAQKPQIPTSAAPPSLFQSRPFAEEPQLETADSQTQQIQAKGHSLSTQQTHAPELPSTPKPPKLTRVQPKLTIGQVGDRYEQEADQVAAQVVQRLNAPKLERSPSIQREALPEEEEELQMKPILQREALPEEEEELQMKSTQEAIGGGDASADLESAINSARGHGQSMDANLQAKMGEAIGADFSGVKIHADSQSDQMNRSIQAKAFTTGKDIFFRQGEYNPGSTGGQELLAHELTHVVQQNRVLTTDTSIQRKPPKQTENRILNEMATGTGSLTANNTDDLLDKMGKGQSASKARQIATQIEAEANRLVENLPQPQQQQVRSAIKDYVVSSSAIQDDARATPNAPGQAVQALDAALNAIRQQIAANGASNERIVYRSISYPSGADIPYGQADQNGNIINVGDFVGDLGFLSTSEHRQFILGKEQTAQVQGLLKIAIHSKTGVPIAIDIPIFAYSNTNQKTAYDMQQQKKHVLTRTWNQVFGSGAGAGQAEVLFSRNSVFTVKKIERNGDKVSVVLEEHTAPRPPLVKSMKFATAI